MKTVLNIMPVSDADSQGKRLYNQMFLIPEDDVDLSTPPTISESARTCGALTLKTSAAWKQMWFAKFTTEFESSGNGNDITTEVTNTIKGTLAGDRLEIDDFIENQHGRGFFIVLVDRFTQKQMIFGRPYCPYYFQSHAKRKNKDNASCDVTFEAPSFFQPLEYTGTITPGEDTVVTNPLEE